MFYTIYKITNLINGKYYIGKHQTNDLNDGYFGSGKLLKRAIKKYGIDNFTKDLLVITDTEAKMNLAERILVVPDPTNYNLCTGGQGGFSYINQFGNPRRGYTKEEQRRGALNGYKRNGMSKTFLAGRKIAAQTSFLGKHHTDEWKKSHSQKMKILQSGSKNSQFGTCWITKDGTNKKIPKTDLDKWVQLGYSKGRITPRSIEDQAV